MFCERSLKVRMRQKKYFNTSNVENIFRLLILVTFNIMLITKISKF